MNEQLNKLTSDTDDGRYSSYSTLIRLPNGRQVVFYEKFFTSGRTSGPCITYTAPFQINVAAGSGTLNSIPVTWSPTSVTATSNTNQIVYVTTAGTVGITDDYPSTFMKDVLLLAIVYNGLATITYIEEIEKDGRYIYGKRQQLVGDSWVWDDYEFILNSGQQPKALYESASGKIYLTYRKDSSAYIRLFNLDDETTWSFLSNKFIQNDVINLLNNPTGLSILSFNCSHTAPATITNVPPPFLSYTLVDHIYGLRSDVGTTTRLLRPPFVTFGANDPDITSLTLEIYTYNGSEWILEDETPIRPYTDKDLPDLFEENPATPGVKRMYIKFFTIFFTRYGGVPQYVRLPYDSEYVTSPIVEYFNDQIENHYTDDSGNIVSKIIEPRFNGGTEGIRPAIDAGRYATSVKTYEYDQLFGFRDDLVVSNTFSTGLNTATTVDYYQLAEYESDTAAAPLGGCSVNVGSIITT